MDKQYTVPIILFVFRRLESVKALMNVIKAVQPEILYVFGDGAREGREEEKNQVAAVRAFILDAVDWKCKFYPFFSDINKGCAKNICEGVDYVFQYQKYAVIFEDDALPTPAFFKYADILLQQYMNDRRIQYIAGFNAIGDSEIIKESYAFSKNAPMSGAIATWGDRWNECDFSMKNWPKNKKERRFRKYFFSSELYHVTCAAMDDSYLNINDGWDYQFHHDMLDKERYAIVPMCNLVKSQVYCGNAFHPLRGSQEDRVDKIIGHAGNRIQFPLKDPKEMYWNREYDRLRQKLFLNINGNYVQRHIIYIYRRIKEIAYRYLPKRVWKWIADIVKGGLK